MDSTMSKWYSTLVQLMTVPDGPEPSGRVLPPSNGKAPGGPAGPNQHQPSNPPAGAMKSTSAPDLSSWISEFVEFYRERFGEVLVLREPGPAAPGPSRTPEFRRTPEMLAHTGAADLRSSAVIRGPASRQMVTPRPCAAPLPGPARNNRMPQHCRTTLRVRILLATRRFLSYFHIQQKTTSAPGRKPPAANAPPSPSAALQGLRRPSQKAPAEPPARHGTPARLPGQ